MASLKQCAQLISTSGDNVTYFLRGEPGCGKSSVLKLVESILGEGYQYVYADCPLMDLPDFAMPVVEHRTTHFAPSALWGFDDPRPKVIMLDEVSKAPNVVKPMFTRLMLERCIGEFKLPEGSIVFATGNNTSDGVGDTMQGHINNRVTTIQVDKPDSDTWIEWAANNGVNAIVLAAVHQFPHVLNSYLDDPKGENPYIFNPKKNTGAFASPRSLHKAGFICDQRKLYGDDLALEALKGTVGVSFAGDMVAYMNVADQVPTWEQIEADPEKAEVPKSPAAQLLLLFGSVMRVEDKTAPAYVKYFMRYQTELRALWSKQFVNNNKAMAALMKVKAFTDNLVENHWVYNGHGK